jgi:oligopeptide/dipeptide ABC transporter ATP-binding protein
MALLEIDDLHLSLPTKAGRARILNGVNLKVESGEVWGLVGETGCGKSLTGLSVSRLVTPSARYDKGAIRFDGTDVLKVSEAQMRGLRGRRIGMIFQDPTTNLNPVFRVSSQMIDIALEANAKDPSILGLQSRAGRSALRSAARERSVELLQKVGITNAAERIDDFPFQFSGGMKQRVLIAMALIGRPDLLIADEPTTALDVLVQEQILDLLKQIVRDEMLAVLLITHNLGVVASLCSHVAVMYAGNVVEEGETAAVLGSPVHPYTKALLAAIPPIAGTTAALVGLPGEIPDLTAPPAGCRLVPRCTYATGRCSDRFPPLLNVGLGHRVACTLAETPAPEKSHA